MRPDSNEATLTEGEVWQGTTAEHNQGQSRQRDTGEFNESKDERNEKK